MRTLLIDCNYFPVKIISWQKAISLLVAQKAQSVEDYSDITIRSTSKKINLPKILRLESHHRVTFKVKFTRLNVFLRDDFSCQYCGRRQDQKELTFDHVIPVSKNGPTTWENVVTSCKLCNSKKGPKLLEDTNLKLMTPPKKPRWSPELCFNLGPNDPDEWYEFLKIKKRSDIHKHAS